MSRRVPDLDAAIAAKAFSGVVAVHERGKRVFERAEGFAHRALQVPNSAETRFATASGSKGFTALAAMALVEQDVLELDAPVRPILGTDLPLIDSAVTLRHLLAHTSGIGDYLDEDADWGATDYVLKVPVHELATTEGFVRAIDGFAQKEAPGERFRYNNGAFIVIALVAERASGKPFHDLVAEAVCAPAGLTHTSYLRSDELPGDAALGYLDAQGDRTNVLHLPVRGNGDGGMYTTADDLARFWEAFAAGRIVSPATVAAMTTPTADVPSQGARFGMGVWLRATGPAWFLEGFDAGVSFRSTHDPTTGLTVSVLGNTHEGAWPVVRACDAMFE